MVTTSPDANVPPEMLKKSTVGGIVLAAGRSRRFAGSEPKQLCKIHGETMIHRVTREALASRLGEVVVVLGYQAHAIRRAIADLSTHTVVNEDFRLGQSTSVRRGLEALTTSTRAAMFIPADQPFLTARLIDRLIDTFETSSAIVVPTRGGQRAAPVLFPRHFFDQLSQLEGDRGGRALFAAHEKKITELEVEEARELWDIDTREDLEENFLLPR